MKNWYRGKFYLYSNNDVEDDELVDLVTTIEHSVMQYGIELVIVDNLMTALDVDMAADEYRCQSKFVKKVESVSEAVGCCRDFSRTSTKKQFYKR